MKLFNRTLWLYGQQDRGDCNRQQGIMDRSYASLAFKYKLLEFNPIYFSKVCIFCELWS
jgi:hypothetical protein